jgi:hypothetical protein
MQNVTNIHTDIGARADTAAKIAALEAEVQHHRSAARKLHYRIGELKAEAAPYQAGDAVVWQRGADLRVPGPSFTGVIERVSFDSETTDPVYFARRFLANDRLGKVIKIAKNCVIALRDSA